MASRRKARHVGADLGEDALRAAGLDADHGAQQLNRRRERGAAAPRSRPRVGRSARRGRRCAQGSAARDLLDVPGVDQQALEVVFEDRPGRLPVDAGGLHHHLLDPVRSQPIAQAEQSADRGGELRDVFLTLAARVRAAHARGDVRLVNQRRRALDDQLHLASFVLDDIDAQPPPRGLDDNESGSRARSTVRSSGETPHAKLKTGSRAPRQGGRRHGRRPGSSLPFHAPARVREADRTTQSDSAGRAGCEADDRQTVAALSRRRSASWPGGRPNWRRYSRLNCDALSYPTR
jgi:hypothetical protein